MSKVQIIRLSAVTVALGMTVAAALPAAAKTVEIQMKNNGTGGMMVFEPSYVVAKPGDTIRFVPTNPGHNAETIAGMIPTGAQPAAGAIGKPLDYKVAKPGLYGFECKPHFGMGMVALVKVGTGAPANLKAASAVTLPPLAAKRMAPMLASAGR